MTTPTCPECHRAYTDPLGCDPFDGGPLAYGDELNPLSSGPTCRDCGTPFGSAHHAGCACTECASCHRQYHGDMTCEEDRLLVTGGMGA